METLELDSIVDYAVYNYLHSQEFWNQLIVFGNEIFNFEMNLENLFFYSDYGVKGINIEFSSTESLCKLQKSEAKFQYKLSNLVKINYVDLNVDLLFLTKFYFYDCLVRHIYVKDDTLYKNLECYPKLYFYFDLNKYNFEIDASNYSYTGHYTIDNIDELNFLNNIKNKNNISIKYKVLSDFDINVICKVYESNDYESVEIDLRNCSLDICQQIFNSLIESNIGINDNRTIVLSQEEFYASKDSNNKDKEVLCINNKCKILMEMCLKYFSKVLLAKKDYYL